MAKYNRVLLNYLKSNMSPDAFAIYLDFIDQDEDIESFYDEEIEEEKTEEEVEEEKEIDQK